jgi:hypothetical protein
MATDYSVCYFETMNVSRHQLLLDLESIVAAARDRQSSLEDVL